MKWTEQQISELKRMCFAEDADVRKPSNAEIAKHFGVPVTEIHAKRSQLGITIPKVRAAQGKPALTVNQEFEAAIVEMEKNLPAIGNKFAIQVISKGAFVDGGVGDGSYYLVEVTTIRLNHVALNAWILSDCLNTRDCYKDGEEGNSQWEAHKAEYDERRKDWNKQIIGALEIASDAGSVSITQSQSEVFTVVHIRKVHKSC